MNVIVSNKQKDIIDNANIDAIKDLNGLFSIDELINKFKNYFFSKMILDATSIIDFSSEEVINKLASEIGSERLFILLPSNPEPPKNFVDKLVSLKIYNFSTKIEELVNYINRPRVYNDIIGNEDIPKDDFYVDNSVKENNNSFENEKTNLNNQDNFYADNSVKESSNSFESEKTNLNNQDEFAYKSQDNNLEEYNSFNGRKVIGFKNVTLHAGSTTLIYMLIKVFKEKFNKRVLGIEVNKNDFSYFQDDRMISVKEENLDNAINSTNAEIILVDLNDCHNLSICNEVIHLVEPSIIKLNKLMIENRFAFRELQGKHVILNKSLLSNNDVDALSNEAHVKMSFNIPPVNDRIYNDIIIKFIHYLGLN